VYFGVFDEVAHAVLPLALGVTRTKDRRPFVSLNWLGKAVLRGRGPGGDNRGGCDQRASSRL
jgi:hypothetical protein